MTATTDNEMDKLLGQMKSTTSRLREVFRDLHGRLATRVDGHIADYIPELATANPLHFGMSFCAVDGTVVETGDFQQPFTIQSISKPFVFGMALEEHGVDQVLSKVGVEPTGEAFNSIVLDEASNRPFNPMVNAGAIATADLIVGKDYPERVKKLLVTFSNYCGRPVHVDNAVFMSERLTGHRNRAMAHLMRNFGMVGDRFEDSLELYFQQCSIVVTAHDLAVMGATLARGGVNPLTNARAISSGNVKYLLSAMLTCGMYDFAGEWAFRVGLPAKSGVAGGIVAVIPGVGGIGLYSPLLDGKGNSIRGVEACLELSRRFGLHAFEQGYEGPTLLSQLQSSRGRRSSE